jgi:predicted TPR repeat methyltransferase
MQAPDRTRDQISPLAAPTMATSGKPSHILQPRPTAAIDLAWEQKVILTLYGQRKLAEAEQATRSLIQRAPEVAFGWKVLGLLLQQKGQLQEALSAMQQAIRLQPKDPEAFNNLGALQEALEQPEHALVNYEHALKLKPDFAHALNNLVNLIRRMNMNDSLLPMLQRLQALRPGDEQLRFMVAMLSGQSVDQAPAAYVSNLFDRYAERFDAHLQGELAYDAPRGLAALIRQHLTQPAGWRVLDLGCGTGLIGEQLHPQCSTLVGIDLSAGMLAKAEARGGYTRLIQGDLLPAMQAEPSATFDVIVAADVFVYVGKIDAVVAQARRLLAPGGLLAFTVESMEATEPSPDDADLARGHRLERSGRYTHAEAHLRALAAQHGLRVLSHQATTIRQDKGRSLAGLLVLWQG